MSMKQGAWLSLQLGLGSGVAQEKKDGRNGGRIAKPLLGQEALQLSQFADGSMAEKVLQAPPTSHLRESSSGLKVLRCWP